MPALKEIPEILIITSFSASLTDFLDWDQQGVSVAILGLSALDAAHGISSEGPIEKLFWALAHLGSSHRLSFSISLLSFIALLAIRAFKTSNYCRTRMPALKYIREILIITALSASLTDFFDWDQQGFSVFGSIHPDQLTLAFLWKGPNKNLIKDTLGTAFTICICSFVGSIVAAKGESSSFHYSISPNRELVTLGAANIFSSVVSGRMPGPSFFASSFLSLYLAFFSTALNACFGDSLGISFESLFGRDFIKTTPCTSIYPYIPFLGLFAKTNPWATSFAPSKKPTAQ